MKTITAKIAAIAVTAFLFSGCATTGAMSRTGYGLITVVKEGGEATSAAEITSTGRSCSINIMGIISAGNSTIEKAKLDGDIEVVSSVDREYINIIGLFGRYCTVVRGGSQPDFK